LCAGNDEIDGTKQLAALECMVHKMLHIYVHNRGYNYDSHICKQRQCFNDQSQRLVLDIRLYSSVRNSHDIFLFCHLCLLLKRFIFVVVIDSVKMVLGFTGQF
jgi:hypothetical protein